MVILKKKSKTLMLHYQMCITLKAHHNEPNASLK